MTAERILAEHRGRLLELEAVPFGDRVALVIVGGERCAECGAGVRYVRGPQWSGWVAPELGGHLRGACYREADGTWRGHRPAGDRSAR
jgi:hypothetical protein